MMVDGRNPTVLLVDDSPATQKSLGAYLSSHGMSVFPVENAIDASVAIEAMSVDLVLLEARLLVDGEMSLRKWFASGCGPALILLTAQANTADRIAGLEMGADDFVSKSCAPRELLARIRSVLRRTRRQKRAPECLRISDMLYNAQLKRLIRDGGDDIRLTGGENRLLSVLFEHRGQTVSRADLIPIVTGREAHNADRTIDNVISRLRRKIELDPGDPQLIITERGGYRLASAAPYYRVD